VDPCGRMNVYVPYVGGRVSVCRGGWTKGVGRGNGGIEKGKRVTRGWGGR